MVRQSPIIPSTDFNFSGTDVGRTQYVDAFQRANFWDVINHGDYHVRLGPVKFPSLIVIHLAASNGLALSPSIFNNCGPLRLIEGGTFDDLVTKTILPSLAAQGVNPSTFPIFLLSNVGLTFGNPTNIFNCCALGYHGATGAPSGLTRRLISTPVGSSVQGLLIARPL